jgi:hypothetical protein
MAAVRPEASSLREASEISRGNKSWTDVAVAQLFEDEIDQVSQLTRELRMLHCRGEVRKGGELLGDPRYRLIVIDLASPDKKS